MFPRAAREGLNCRPDASGRSPGVTEKKEVEKMFGIMKKPAQLEGHLQKLQVNAANNYKDEAIRNFSDFCREYEALKAAGKINEKQRKYYDAIEGTWKQKLKGYSHGEQKPDYKGLYKG